MPIKKNKLISFCVSMKKTGKKTTVDFWADRHLSAMAT